MAPPKGRVAEGPFKGTEERETAEYNEGTEVMCTTRLPLGAGNCRGDERHSSPATEKPAETENEHRNWQTGNGSCPNCSRQANRERGVQHRNQTSRSVIETKKVRTRAATSRGPCRQRRRGMPKMTRDDPKRAHRFLRRVDVVALLGARSSCKRQAALHTNLVSSKKACGCRSSHTAISYYRWRQYLPHTDVKTLPPATSKPGRRRSGQRGDASV